MLDPNKNYYPLTYNQKLILNIERLITNTSIGNINYSLDLKGEIYYDILKKAINLYIEKNDGMRIRIVDEGREPKQYVIDYKKIIVDFLDFSLSNGMDRFYSWIKEQCRIPFNLFDSDLFYFAIYKIDDSNGGFYCKTHHLISDVWCINLMAKQVMDYYRCLKNNLQTNPLSEYYPCFIHNLPIPLENNLTYKNYLLSENEYIQSQQFEKSKEFWLERFITIPNITILKPQNLNYRTTKAQRLSYILNSELTFKIHAFCEEHQLPPFVLFLTLLAIYLYRITSNDSMVIGSSVPNRFDVIDKNTHGMYMNTVPLKINMNEEEDFLTCIHRINHEWLLNEEHHKYPYNLIFEDVKGKIGDLSQLYNITLSYQGTNFTLPEVDQIHDIKLRCYSNGYSFNSLDIYINNLENHEQLILNYDYQVEIFKEKEIQNLHGHLLNILNEAIKNPNKKLHEYEMLSEEEKYRILYEFNNNKKEYPKGKTIHELFEIQAEKTPNNIAVVFEDLKLTYRELNEKANQLARLLRENGVKPDYIVGIMVNRSIEMIVGILGILKAGGAYLPIDSDYPEERIKFMLENSKTGILLTQKELLNKVIFKGTNILIDDETTYKGNVENIDNLNKENDLLYAIYTSGSTGTPKGVLIEHKNLVNLLNHEFTQTSLDFTGNVLQFTTICFDVSYQEIFSTLISGGQLYVANNQTRKDLNKLLDYISINQINLIFLPPALLKLISSEEKYINKFPSSLKHIVTAGEQQVINKNLKKYLIKNNTSLHNHYGPSETHEITTYTTYPENEIHELPPIGKPIINNNICIVDKYNSLLPIGVPGELIVSGDNVGRGYLDNASLTKTRFSSNPIFPKQRTYRTGDLARWLPDGNIEYIGRIDNQVKLRGFRVELGEIESKLISHNSIKAAVVIAKEDTNNDKYLCAYIVTDSELRVTELRQYLSIQLPDYMIPSCFVQLDKLPLTPNGKVDRKMLPDPSKNIKLSTEYVVAYDKISKELTKIWAEVLEVKRIGIDDNFFELGGNSIAVMKVLVKAFPYNWEIQAQDIYQYPTIRELTEKIKNKSKDNELTTNNVSDIMDVSKLPVLLSDNYQINNILLTGATGFLGIHILNELLTRTNSNLYCLVRGENAEERLLKQLEYYFPNKYSGYIGNRVMVINGDITQHRLGLEDAEYKQLGEKIDVIIHAAANVKYFGKYSDIEKINVLGTENVIDFATEYHKKLCHISTTDVSGQHFIGIDNKNNIFTERDFFIGQEYKDNVYIRSKFEAENKVYKAIQNKRLNAKIYRIGNLTGRYSDGCFQINIDENAFYRRIRSIIQIGAVSRSMLELVLELTPVDCCSRAIVELVKGETNNSVFHVFNHKTIKFGLLLDSLASKGIPIKVLPDISFQEYISDLSQNQEGMEFLTGVINDLNNNKVIKFNSSIVVDSTLTQECLKKLEINWPYIDDEYLSKVIKHMQDIGYTK